MEINPLTIHRTSKVKIIADTWIVDVVATIIVPVFRFEGKVVGGEGVEGEQLGSQASLG